MLTATNRHAGETPALRVANGFGAAYRDFTDKACPASPGCDKLLFPRPLKHSKRGEIHHEV
jgi:hypothetical protein